MDKLRKQIRESFFNPVLHFLPLLIFLVVDEYLGVYLAWNISFPVALTLMLYVYFVYNRLFNWHLLFVLLFLEVGILRSIQLSFSPSGLFDYLGSEVIFSFFLFSFILFRKHVQVHIRRIVPKLIPMTNNFVELNRLVFRLLVVMSVFILGKVILYFYDLTHSPYQQLLQCFYVGSLLFLFVYEMLRVFIIRAKLAREEWWPIMNEQGKIVGSIQCMLSLNDEKKYMHPIIRVLMIDKSMVLLQKRSYDSVVYPGLWDTVISNHVSMGETIERCIERTAEERFSLCNFKYMYLSNYTLEVEKESHYAFLFVSCQEAEYKLNYEYSDQLKWWTQQQIEEEFGTGIFTENFKVEYDLLLRSGLLESGKCECSCRLKQVIYEQSNAIKKDQF